jgi:hypothetical protein
MTNDLPIPGVIPVPAKLRVEDAEDAALELYRRVAEADRRYQEMERRQQSEIAETSRKTHRLISALAAERFEFDRLMRRLKPELERRNAGDLIQLLDLFAKAWDLKLGRASIQVVDLAGLPLSDELAGDVEVESHFPDPSVVQATVRETLIPLVLLEGKTIGSAKIITAVPVAVEEDAQ